MNYDDYRKSILAECEAIANEYGLSLQDLKEGSPVLYRYVNGKPKHYGSALRELCVLVAMTKGLKEERERNHV